MVTSKKKLVLSLYSISIVATYFISRVWGAYPAPRGLLFSGGYC